MENKKQKYGGKFDLASYLMGTVYTPLDESLAGKISENSDSKPKPTGCIDLGFCKAVKYEGDNVEFYAIALDERVCKDLPVIKDLENEKKSLYFLRSYIETMAHGRPQQPEYQDMISRIELEIEKRE